MLFDDGRCGESGNKPFCDALHVRTHFADRYEVSFD